MKKLFFDKYAGNIILIYLLIILFRIIETCLIFYNYTFDYKVFTSELFGLLTDITGSGILLTAYIFIAFLLSKFKIKIWYIVNLILLLFITLAYIIIVKYFVYQLSPLDIFLYKYSFKELFFTVSTSSSNILITIIGIIILLLIIILLTQIIKKVKFGKTYLTIIYLFVIISVPTFFTINKLCKKKQNKYSLNKPVYFINKSIQYFFLPNLTNNNAINEFKTLYPEKEFINHDYPLVHKAIRNNELSRYFKGFATKPNIVFLIIEGLNDDFIHEYKGVQLMPFLSQLKNKSLYWKRCFTLGERSFAVVPSILGGLPYGEKGFTVQHTLPRHLSLVSVLNSNNYYTSFFYGQGAWFHQKDRFFKYNDIDLIFDNSKFDDNYTKIIVGDDNFFWGYNDKDLFNQSLKVIDTLTQSPRLDIYFTGTSHSPYVISNNNYYNNKSIQLTNEPYTEFFKTYSKYLKSLLFVDDALKDFFNEYKKRNGYENTIFIITGDHPMTELPISNSLKRYHVPLIIFSDNLKTHHTFKNTVSHLDVPETLLSFLNNYITNIPTISTSLGSQLFNNDNDTTKNIAFMNNNRQVVDFLSGNYYLSDNKLYSVDSLLNITENTNSSIKAALTKKLSIFKNTNLYVTRNNFIISNHDYCKQLNLNNIYTNQKTDSIKLTAEYYNLTDNIIINNSDFVFDISLKIMPANNISIVYQITDKNDSTLLWQNIGVIDNDITQAHININKQNINDSIVKFKSYLWNKSNTEFTLSDLNVLLYSQKK